MDHKTQPLEYRSAPLAKTRVRPRLWLSHMLTAACLCVIALLLDWQLRYDALEAAHVSQIEMVLAIYGATCAIVSIARRGLLKRDKLAVAGCLLLFAFTAFVACFMPRVIHN